MCFYSTRIGGCGKDQKKLFKLPKNVMGSNSNVNLPYLTSAEFQADKSSNYCHEENNNHLVSEQVMQLGATAHLILK